MKANTTIDFESSGGKVTGLPSPTADSDAATKGYVDSAVEGLNWKDSVRAASIANVDISSAPSTVDGITLVSGDRVLLKDQTTGSQNGIYVFNGAASAMTRATDADTAANLEQACVVVEEGTTNAGTTWRQTLVNFTLGSGSPAFTTFGTAAGAASESSAGIIEIATQGETDTGTDDARAITPLKLATSPWAKRKHTATIGDGSNTQIDVTHNFGTKEVIVQARLAADDSVVLCDITMTSTNAVRFNFAVAPTTNAIKVVIIA